MQYIAATLVVAALIAPVAAQNLRSRLVANAPVTLTTPAGNASQPAGPLPATGAVSVANSFVTWSRTGNEWRFDNDLWGWPTPAGVSLDCTLSLAAGARTFGHLRLEVFSVGDFPGNPTVDVFDDGTVDAELPTFGSRTMGLGCDTHVPLRLSVDPVRIRIRMTGSTPSWMHLSIVVRWEPWVSGAKNLGSSCIPNRIYASGSLEDYFLAALPGTAGNAVDFEADGRGSLATFVVSLAPQRLAPGTLGFGFGCDDLLLAPLFDTPGASIGTGRWRLSVPPLPPGLTLYVQHVSIGLGLGVFSYLGATNLVSYRT